MIFDTPKGQIRSQLFGGVDSIPMPSQEGGTFGSWTAAGRRVSTADAMGLPAILAGVRFLAETVATFPLAVYEHVDDRLAEAVGSDQWYLFNTRPSDQQTPFMFKAFMVAAMIGHGNFVAQKARSRGRVQGIYSMDPRKVRVVREKGEVIFKVHEAGKAPVELTREQVIHIPGVLADDPEIGVSPMRVAANALGAALGTEEYASKFFANDATPAGVVQFPFGADTQQAKDAKAAWNESGQGSGKAHKTRVLFSGATYEQIGVNALDAQIIESQRWSVEQSARVLRLPNWALGVTEKAGGRSQTPEQKNTELLSFSILPWLCRIEEGLHADGHLFPQMDLLKPLFKADAITRADALARAQSNLIARQGGWKSANDIRRDEGLSPIDGGDQYQQTPVGGAENLQPDQADDTESDDSDSN